MKANRIMTLVLAAAVLAVLASGTASAMVPHASLVDGLGAQWNNDPSNSFTVKKGTTFSETCEWTYNTQQVSTSIDAIYAYSSIGTSPQYGQIWHTDALSQYGQSVTLSSEVRARSDNTGSCDYSIGLGFYLNDNTGRSFFANPMEVESLQVTN